MKRTNSIEAVNGILTRPDSYLICLVIVILLWPSLKIQFVSDNINHITSAYNKLPGFADHYFRPFAQLTLLFDYALWGLKPFGFHLTNLLLHLISTIAVYAFVFRIANNRTAAIVSSLLFGLHPIHSMSIFWISGRVDIVCTIFYLGSLILLIDFTRARRTFYLILSIGFYVAALATKEMALSLPLTAAAYLLIWSQDRSYSSLKSSFSTILPYIVITIAYLILKYSQLGSDTFVGSAHYNIAPTHLLKNLSMFAGFLIVPGGLIEIGTFLQSHRTLFLLLSGVAFCAFILSLKWIKRSQVTLFAILFIVLTLLPVIRLAMRWYMYLPSVGYCALIGYLIGKFWYHTRKKTALVLGVGLIAVIYATFLTIEQNRWIASGRLAKEVVTEIASTVHSEDLSTGYVLTVPAELQQTPVYILGLGLNVNAALSELGYLQDSVSINPVLLISLSAENDYDNCVVVETDTGTFDVSLENTESYFVFPHEIGYVSGSRSIQVNDVIERETYTIIVNHLNQSGEANEVTVSFRQLDHPVLLYEDGTYQVHSLKDNN